MSAATPRCLDEALACQELGMRIVVFRNRLKYPSQAGWGNNTTLDDIKLYKELHEYPDSNIGLLLGKYPDGDPLPGIIDIEYDDEEGKKTADELLSGIQTPTYKSIRSVHRLFLWNDDLPPIQKIAKGFGGLEVRLGGGQKQTQSVLPPSTHPDDPSVQYSWLPTLSPHEVGFEPVPDEIQKLIVHDQLRLDRFGGSSHTATSVRSAWDAADDGEIGEGSRNESLAQICGRVLGNRDIDINDKLDVTLAYRLVEKKNQRFNPPLGEAEVKQTFRSILSRERSRRSQENDLLDDSPAKEVFDDRSQAEILHDAKVKEKVAPGTHHELKLIQGSRIPHGFTLKIETSDPRRFFLTHPEFKERPSVMLDIKQLMSFDAARTVIAGETLTFMTSTFRKRWPKIVSYLLDHGERLSPNADVDRSLVIGAYIIDGWPNNTPHEMEDIEKNGVTASRGVAQLSDTSIAINFQRLLTEIKDTRILDKCCRSELTETLKKFGAERKRTNQKRWWHLTRHKAEAIEEAIKSG